MAGIGNPTELFRFVGSMEGVPEWIDPSETSGHLGWRKRAYALLDSAGALAPGLLLAFALAALGSAAAPWLSTRRLGLDAAPISPILLAILGGLAIRNTVGLPPAYERGVQLAVRRLLRVGVALLGIRLSLGTALGDRDRRASDRRALHRGRAGGRGHAEPRLRRSAAARPPDRGGYGDLRQHGDRSRSAQ